LRVLRLPTEVQSRSLSKEKDALEEIKRPVNTANCLMKNGLLLLYVRQLSVTDPLLMSYVKLKEHLIMETTCKTCNSFLFRRANDYWLENPVTPEQEDEIKELIAMKISHGRLKRQYDLEMEREVSKRQKACDTEEDGFIEELCDMLVDVSESKPSLDDARVREIIAHLCSKWYPIVFCDLFFTL
jgi:hypothetical protein